MHNYIEGRWVAGEGDALASTCPATGRRIWEGKSASREQVNAAAVAARAASRAWACAALQERVAIAGHFKASLARHAEELARTISQEVGKPLWEARTEVASMVNKVDISIKAHAERTGSRESDAADGKTLLTHRPHGVLAVLG